MGKAKGKTHTAIAGSGSPQNAVSQHKWATQSCSPASTQVQASRRQRGSARHRRPAEVAARRKSAHNGEMRRVTPVGEVTRKLGRSIVGEMR
ncbi:hypothetical protein Nepgr_028982 [Nepenthes gracilis]|uniref:Uncharacterized protein n=1 Tax=Nepenthes gracilis TaxID=150966 RepID=A0AAD3TDX7_NEPGR|nr:hypothetical protein Nepgr_028982 [Nepenthes gracilis]